MPPARTRADACPGALSTHTADDGELARVRLPGGVLSAEQLRVLAAAAVDLGDGDLHLTSRGNVQLRAVRDPVDLAQRLAGAGLLPSATHERVRNILASPLPGLLDVVPLAGALDLALCSDQALANLPGRFLFALDSGHSDVAGEDADVCWRAVDSGVGVLQLGGVDTDVLVPATAAVDVLIRVARAFVELRGLAWRMRELPDGVLADLSWSVFKTYQLPESAQFSATNSRPELRERDVAAARLRERHVAAAPAAPQPGLHAEAVVAAVPLGVLTAAQALVLADVAPSGVLVTPWRSVVLRAAPSGVQHELSAAGLVLSGEDARAQVSACVGRPGCARARADVRADATRAMAVLGASRARRAHFAGCERRCGRPHGAAVDVLAVDGGYAVDGVWVPVDALAKSLQQ